MRRHEAVRRKDERQSRAVRPMMMRAHAQRAAFHDCVCLVQASNKAYGPHFTAFASACAAYLVKRGGRKEEAKAAGLIAKQQVYAAFCALASNCFQAGFDPATCAEGTSITLPADHPCATDEWLSGVGGPMTTTLDVSPCCC